MRLAPALLVLLAALTVPLAMAYCTPADVLARYDETTLARLTGDPAGQTIDEGVLADAVADAGALMAPYVRARYPGVALGASEPTLRALATEATYLELAKRRPLGQTRDEREAAASLLRRLTQIADGTVALELPDDADPDAGFIDPAGAFRSNPRRFGRRDWRR